MMTKYLLLVIKRIMKMDAAIPFNVPVDPVALRLPDYFDVVDTPMDFGTICKHLENGTKYMNSEDVLKDVQCIWKNCYKYYDKGNYILNLMKRVEENFMKYWTAAGLFTEERGTTHDLIAPVANKRKARGPTRNLKLAAIPQGEKFDIAWRNRRPVGANSQMFKTACTILVRQTREIPLQVKGWLEIPFDIKKKLFEHILERFKVEDQMKFVLGQIHRSYNNYRHYLKHWCYDTCKTIEEARANIPPNVNKDDWEYLVNLWSTPSYQEKSKRNKENSAKSTIVTRCGSKSFQQREEEEREKIGLEAGHTFAWKITSLGSDEQAANQISQEGRSQLKNLAAQVSEGASQMSEPESFGPRNPRQEHHYVNGATQRNLWGSSSSTVRELKKQLLQSEQQHKESEQNDAADVQFLKERVSQIEAHDHREGTMPRKLQGSFSSTLHKLKQQLLELERQHEDSEQHDAAEVQFLKEQFSLVEAHDNGDGTMSKKSQGSSSDTVHQLKKRLLELERHRKDSEHRNAAELQFLKEQVSLVEAHDYRDGTISKKSRGSASSTVHQLKKQLLEWECQCKESEQYNAAELQTLKKRASQVDEHDRGNGAIPKRLRGASSSIGDKLEKQLLEWERQRKESEQYNNAAELQSLKERASQVDEHGCGNGAIPKKLRGSSSSTVNELKKQLLESEHRREESDQRNAAEVQCLKEQVNRVEGLLSDQMNRFEGLITQMMSQMSSIPAQTESHTVDPPSSGGGRRRGRRQRR
ncbi:uncharacterized protein LOC107412577 isoform X3 [Ziziphus jujuba]|uniref:Uncharacterized protein LOC107412577 isoform X3 n=1 Tax=Ziziphus jujuba TaxID=326968 RepID=A0ABM3ZUB0_ZIZJJ|nr:uncharacterized protein LOC107412577 isoform X3 [Ziziphus jujuba]